MAKKHKKKIYTTLKKNKHIQKKTPLNIIHYVKNVIIECPFITID